MVDFDNTSKGKLFSTSAIKIHELLFQASANAPVLFETPCEISGQSYIDGGVGGNCPLAQAMPTQYYQINMVGY